LASELLAALHEAIPAGHSGICGVDPATLLINRSLAVIPADRSGLRYFYQHVYLRDPCAALLHHAQMHAGVPPHIIHRQPDRSVGLPPPLLRAVSDVEDYRSFCTAKVPVGGWLRASFAADGEWVAHLQMNRYDHTRPFGPADVGFLRIVAPTIGRALQAALDRERAAAVGTSEDTADASGVLVLAANGRERFHTPVARKWIEVLRNVEVGDDYLPGAIRSAVAGLSAGLHGAAHTRVRVTTPLGRLRVEASPGGEDDAVTVVLTPELPPSSPELPPTWPLTRAERNVVSLLVRGLSNRQLAAALHVSESTIESHLAHVYDKLGVHSRSQLLALFFTETYQLDPWRPQDVPRQGIGP
jgi:DNA-binding NarL/FixJ family response regulator